MERNVFIKRAVYVVYAKLYVLSAKMVKCLNLCDYAKCWWLCAQIAKWYKNTVFLYENVYEVLRWLSMFKNVKCFLYVQVCLTNGNDV